MSFDTHWVEPPPLELIEQARMDLANPMLWEGKRASYYKTLKDLLVSWDHAKKIRVKEATAMDNIVHYNDRLRARGVQLDLQQPVSPPNGAGPETSQVKQAQAPALPTPVGLPLKKPKPPMAGPYPFDPPLNALQIGQGLGLKSGAMMIRWREEPDFPRPWNAEGLPTWRFSEVCAWIATHPHLVEVTMNRSGGRAAMTAKNELDQLRARIAELEAKLQTEG